MCGFTGFLHAAPTASAESLAVIARSMADTLTHRGPDDSGTWVDAAAGVAFGHRRLSIIDLSRHGHQPMTSHSGRYVIAYNGELYNFQDVRRELEGRGHGFAGHSDTEVLLSAVDQWGLENALQRFVGMFAFSLWDRRERQLHLVRDRIGEKPLYYGWQNGVFLFGSELKALRSHPCWRAEIDREALTLYLRFGYVPAPHSIFAGIHKLPPGTVLTIADANTHSYPEPEPYWSLRESAAAASHDHFMGDERQAVAELEELLRTAVGQQMIADVPLGAFLSGGIDSSTIVALMQAQSSQPVRTFTIGFHETGYDEAGHARAVARHLGTDHTELYVTPREAMEVVPLLPRMYDEPFADSSQIPTFLVSQLARQHVTVSLSGDGGDELFGGYTRYSVGPRLWRHVGILPQPVRRAAGSMLDLVGARRWNAVAARADRLFGSGTAPARLGEKVSKLAAVLRSSDGGPGPLYKSLVSATRAPAELVVGGHEPATLIDGSGESPDVGGLAQTMMYLDALTYLPDDILAKVDRASMACSLESRAPFLDHRVVEFAWRLPLHMRVRAGASKWILRQVLYRHVPPRLVERPKSGFSIPIGGWLRGPLRDWAEALMSESRLRDEGFLHGAAVRRVWDEHQGGRYDWELVLWGVLMFQAWLEGERVR
jgi:asparagine synthase (glutamine-hydrolysing)